MGFEPTLQGPQPCTHLGGLYATKLRGVVGLLYATAAIAAPCWYVLISTFPRCIELLFYLTISTTNPSRVEPGSCILIRLGLHVSISGTIDHAADRAKDLELQTFQMFTRNPRGWKFKKLDSDEVQEFRRKVESFGFAPVASHMPYLPNLSSPRKLIYNKSVRSLIAELDRCASLGIPYVVTHLGSHLGQGAEIGLVRLVGAINQALSANDNDVMLLLENTAGTKNSMGSSFEEIKRILDRIENRSRVGICFDTAHAYAAGYDLRTPQAVNGTFAKFGSVLGLKLLKIVHLNDSQGGLGSGRDRHEHIGMGYIGEEGFRALFRHEAVRELPFIMETPIDERRDEIGNIRKVRELAG